MEISDKSSQYKEEPFDKIFSWFISPIRELKNNISESSDGAFLAMSASVAMYERFLIKKAQAEGKGENTWDKRRKIAESQLNLKKTGILKFSGTASEMGYNINFSLQK